MSQQPINYNEQTAYLQGTNEAQKTADNLVKALAPYLEERDKTKPLHILDVGCSDGTFTFLNPSSLTESRLVAYAVFASRYRKAHFGAFSPAYGYHNARGRASVQVMEF